ncbi:MAG: hypothetical protein ACHREM_07775 [Polyangiales bacterium]
MRDRCPAFLCMPLAVLWTLGCGGKLDDGGVGGGPGSLTGLGAEVGADANDAWSADGAAATDASMPIDVVGDAGPSSDAAETIAVACATTGAGTTRPDQLANFDYVLSQTDCPTCNSALTISQPCSARLAGASVTMNAADCLAVTSWVTSDLLVQAVDTGAICQGNVGPAYPPQFIDIDIGTTYHGWKSSTTSCHGAVLPRHYACMQAVLDAYFPGTTLTPPSGS